MYVKNITKGFWGKTVLDGFSADFPTGGISCITGNSGIGKTTLLNIIMKLVPSDGGEIDPDFGGRISAVFQEDRLCERLSAAANVKLVCGKSVSDEDIFAALAEVGLEREDCIKPVSKLSGGMRRRAAVVRAVIAESDILIMDEPFKGLDEGNRRRTVDYVLKNRRGRTLIAVTHDPAEIDMLGGKIFKISAKAIDE